MAASVRFLVDLKSVLTATTRHLNTSCCLWKITPCKSKLKQSSREWITRQINDPYIKQARLENFRCRSAFKLLEIDGKYSLIKPGDVVVDCGAAPGSWCQVALQRISDQRTESTVKAGIVIGVDLQPLEPIEGVITLGQSDFTNPKIQSKILNALEGRLVNVVLSDMAPQATGQKDMDHYLICELVLSVLKFSTQVLNFNGQVLCKLWDGQDRVKMVSLMKKLFQDVKIVKPNASRSDSAEIYLLGQHYRHKR